MQRIDANIGRYVDVDGSIQEWECTEGSFQPLRGQTSCMLASAGHYGEFSKCRLFNPF